MKVSIVTISLNQAPFLERAILSVVEQDHDDIEYIVVDPGSTDGSRDIIERYRDRISVAVLEPDAGPADGLNMGFARATGDIFGYINADDAYLPGAIGKAVDAFRASPAADVVCGHGFIVNANGAVRRRFYSDQFSAGRYVHGGVTVMQQSTFFRRDAFQAASAGQRKWRRHFSSYQWFALISPSKGFCQGSVEIFDEGFDPRLELLGRAEVAATDDLADQDREPDLDLIEP